jgi:GTP:adenosylcobinamide-phosphate guanylyltransferase
LESGKESFDCDEDVVLGMEGRGGRGKAEGEEFIDLFNQALIVAVNTVEGDDIKTIAEETEVSEEKETTYHAVAFGSV